VSLRRRVLAYLALAAIVSCALTVGIGIVLVRRHIADQQSAQLRSTADLIATVGGAPGAQRAGDHVYRVDARRRHEAGPRFTVAVVSAIGSDADAQGTIHLRGHAFSYVARRTASGRVILLRRADLPFADWRPFLEALALAGVAGALLAVALAWVLARRLTRPIHALAQATHRLADGESGVTVPVTGDDELADLGRSFNTMSVELARARESQRTFLESVSHELKTPLTSVRGYAEALEEGAVAPRDAARVIIAEAGRLESLVFDLLDLARLGRAGFSVADEPVDLAGVAAAVVTRHGVRARELAVTLSRDGEGSAWVRGDEGRLLQAASNLVENALRLTPPGGAVTVSVARDGLEVRDTGPGLEPPDLGRAFERFYLHDRYRADPGRSVGSGLGLAIVAQLVAAMGGRVRVANRAGGGACFAISLPSGEPESVRPRSPARQDGRRSCA
jgi:two-component system OmpR family sensor kinase